MTGAGGQETGRKRPPHNSSKGLARRFVFWLERTADGKHFLAKSKPQHSRSLLKCTCH
jgi:hypothetical protein